MIFKFFFCGIIRQNVLKFGDQMWGWCVWSADTCGSVSVSIDYADSLFVTVLAMLYASVVIFWVGNRLGNVGSGIFAVFVTFSGLINLSFYIWYGFRDFWKVYFRTVESSSSSFVELEVPVVRITLGNWVSCSNFEICWGFIFDPLAITMMWVILFVTLAVQIYCLDYMGDDPFQSKFYAYLSILAFFMLFLVPSDNYLQIFLGWEGVGLVPLMLISFWNSRKDAVFAGMKAMFMNRFGDLFFIAAMVICLDQFGSLNLENIKFLLDSLECSPIIATLSIVSFCFIIAAMTKSAQLGLHMWLPDAMEGPTPVSALIHAATMVTAGIFVLIRSSFLPVLVPSALGSMAFVGGLTAVFGASVACVQFDIKKVIAYSTCSQLGYMMFACGVGNFIGALFHPVNHAFFKAALFLSAGSVIHAMGNEQDMRKMGALANFLPVTFGVMVISPVALAGFPFFSGFYSKDYILEFSYSATCATSILSYILGLFGAFGTSAYSFRLLYLVFLGDYQGNRSSVSAIHESPKFMLIGLVLLVIPAISFGYLFADLFVGQPGAWLWESCVTNSSILWFILPPVVKQAPFIFSVSGLFVAYVYYTFQPRIFVYILESSSGKWFYFSSARKWYFDDLFEFSVYRVMWVNFRYFWTYFEQGVLVYFGPMGLTRLFASLSTLVDASRTSETLMYLKSIFYCLLISSYVWFVEVNFFDHLEYLFILQIMGMAYYLTRLVHYLSCSSMYVYI